MQMLTVQTSCKKQYTCKVFVLLFHDIKIVKLSNCGKHWFLRIFLCGRKSRIWCTIFCNVSSLNCGQGSEKFGWSSSRKCSCWILEWNGGCESAHLSCEQKQLIWQHCGCGRVRAAGMGIEEVSPHCCSQVHVCTWAWLIHIFFFREMLFVLVSLTRREELKSWVLSD